MKQELALGEAQREANFTKTVTPWFARSDIVGMDDDEPPALGLGDEGHMSLNADKFDGRKVGCMPPPLPPPARRPHPSYALAHAGALVTSNIYALLLLACDGPCTNAFIMPTLHHPSPSF